MNTPQTEAEAPPRPLSPPAKLGPAEAAELGRRLARADQARRLLADTASVLSWATDGHDRRKCVCHLCNIRRRIHFHLARP